MCLRECRFGRTLQYCRNLNAQVNEIFEFVFLLDDTIHGGIDTSASPCSRGRRWGVLGYCNDGDVKGMDRWGNHSPINLCKLDSQTWYRLWEWPLQILVSTRAFKKAIVIVRSAFPQASLPWCTLKAHHQYLLTSMIYDVDIGIYLSTTTLHDCVTRHKASGYRGFHGPGRGCGCGRGGETWQTMLSTFHFPLLGTVEMALQSWRSNSGVGYRQSTFHYSSLIISSQAGSQLPDKYSFYEIGVALMVLFHKTAW